MAHFIFGLTKLEKGMKNLPKDEVENKRLDYLKDLVQVIVDVYQKRDIMPPLETKEEAEKRQQEQGLKILNPQQMITRLPILLAN